MSKAEPAGAISRPRLIERAAYLVLVYTAFFALYGLSNRLVSLAGCHDLTMALDRRIPLMPLFIYPFYLAYPLMAAPGLIIHDRALLRRTALAFLALIATSCMLFLIFPVYVPRPASIPPSFAGELVLRIYRADRPVCGFPSLHVSCAVLATLALFRERRLFGWMFLPFAAATALATLFVKQHVAADVIGGAGLALMMDFALIKPRSRA